MTRSRVGFSLAEVLISLLLLVIAVLAVVAILPSGIASQQQVRFEMYASAKALEMVDGFSATDDVGFMRRVTDFESNAVAQRIRREWIFGKAMQFDIEHRIVSRAQMNFPVPTQIARRLDAPNDEIQQVINDGGHLYYPHPNGFRNLNRYRRHWEDGFAGGSKYDTNELQQLVFAFKGPAQQNLLPNHPYMNAPYFELYPFPPQAVLEPGTERRFENQFDIAADGSLVLAAANVPVAVGADSKNYQWLVWRYMSDKALTLGRTGDKWAIGFPLYKTLVEDHWARIYHQLEGGPGSWTIENLPPGFTDWDYVDPNRGPARIDLTGSDGSVIQDFTNGDMPYAGDSRKRGVPMPPNGRTDIIGVDDSDDKDRTMYGLPGLIRRMMYRHAALELWIGLDPSNRGGAATNPLLEQVPLPADPRDIHPADIYALSHLAHAAMMVTGYRPPYFNDNGNAVIANDVNTGDNKRFGHPSPENLLPFDDLDGFDALWSAASTTTIGAIYGSKPELLYPANPMPPPYADWPTGRSLFFDEMLDATWKSKLTPFATAGVYVDTDGRTVDGWNDSLMARNAMETLVTWAMAYLASHPYDTTLPRPINRQLMMDKPLYAFDLFDASGNARRPSNPAATWGTTSEPFYKVISGRSDKLLPGANGPQIVPLFTKDETKWPTWDSRMTQVTESNPALLRERFWYTRAFEPAER